MTVDWQKVAKTGRHSLQIEALELIDSGEASSPVEIADILKAPLGNVSYHVKVLKEDGLIRVKSTEQRRGALAHFYEVVA